MFFGAMQESDTNCKEMALPEAPPFLQLSFTPQHGVLCHPAEPQLLRVDDVSRVPQVHVDAFRVFKRYLYCGCATITGCPQGPPGTQIMLNPEFVPRRVT